MLFRLAFRNLWRNRRRTLLTMSAMVLSSSLLILALGVFSGMFADMLASATEQYHGHLVVSSEGYQDEREMFANFAEGDFSIGRLRGESEISGVSPRLRAFGLLAHEKNTLPTELLGVRPDLERQVTNLWNRVVAGSYLDSAAEDGAFIGAGLARKLGAGPGDELVFVTQAADGSIGNDLLKVSGVFETGASGLDNSLALVPLPWLQEVIVLPGRLHELALRAEEPMEAAALASEMKAHLPEKMEVLDWGELLPEMREAIAAYDVSRMILVLILYAATGLGILNTFFMSVMERTREFGILMAVGMKPGQVRLLVLLETFFMGTISLFLGLGAGLAMTFYMQEVGIDLSAYLTAVTYAGGTILPRLSAVFETGNLLIPPAVLILVCLAAGYLPSRRAARLRPIEAIREE